MWQVGANIFLFTKCPESAVVKRLTNRLHYDIDFFEHKKEFLSTNETTLLFVLPNIYYKPVALFRLVCLYSASKRIVSNLLAAPQAKCAQLCYCAFI